MALLWEPEEMIAGSRIDRAAGDRAFLRARRPGQETFLVDGGLVSGVQLIAAWQTRHGMTQERIAR